MELFRAERKNKEKDLASDKECQKKKKKPAGRKREYTRKVPGKQYLYSERVKNSLLSN